MTHYIVEIRNNFDAEVFRDELIQPSLAFNPATYREVNRLFNKYRFRGCKLTLTFEPVSYQADMFVEDDLPF